jgi:NTE family protein
VKQTPPSLTLPHKGGGNAPEQAERTWTTEGPAKRKTLALALGGGGARGLAHIAVIEALDEIGVRPVAIAGSSIGAAIGAAYAAGMDGKSMRRLAIRVAHARSETIARLVTARAAGALFPAALANPMLLDAKKLAAAFLPPEIPENFAALKIPLTVLATDLYERYAVPFTAGALRDAIAASMAVPGLVRPVEIDGRVLVDGSAVEPLPFRYLVGRADVILAVDVSGGSRGRPREIPDPWECLFTTLQIMGRAIVNEQLEHGAPDLLIRPNIGAFRMLDFFRASAILRAADAVKEEVKAQVAKLLAG